MWVPKDKKKLPLKEVVIGLTGSGAVNLLEIKAIDGRIVKRMKYDNYMKVEEREIPLYFETHQISGDGENFEKTELSNPDRKPSLPAIIKKFRIPKNVKVEYFEI